MSCLKEGISMPLSYRHKSNTSCQNVSCTGRKFSIRCPGSSFFYITNFHHFQIVHTSLLSPLQSKSNSCIKSTFHPAPKKSNFSKKTIHRRQTCLTYHKNSPPQGCRRRARGKSLLIPQILGTLSFCWIGWIVQLIRAHLWPLKLPPNSHIHNGILKHMPPKSTNSFSSSTAQRHLKQSHMTNTTKPKQTLLLSLSQRSQRSQNLRNHPEKDLPFSKGQCPQPMPPMCPKSKNPNFGLNTNPQRNTCPPSSLDIRDPEMKGSCSLFPQKTQTYLPNSLQEKEGIMRPGNKSSHCPQISFTSMPVQKAHSKQKLTTPECTQQKIFHSCFQRVSAFRIQPTLDYLRKTLLLQALIHGHLIYRLNKKPSTKNRKKSQINIFRICNQSNFLPMKRNPQNQGCPDKKKRNLQKTISIFLETSTLTKAFNRNPKKDQSTQKKLPYSPPCQSRRCVCRTPHRNHHFFILLSQCVFFRVSRNLCTLFCNWSDYVVASIPKLYKERCHQILFRPHLYQIQCHKKMRKNFLFSFLSKKVSKKRKNSFFFLFLEKMSFLVFLGRHFLQKKRKKKKRGMETMPFSSFFSLEIFQSSSISEWFA